MNATIKHQKKEAKSKAVRVGNELQGRLSKCNRVIFDKAYANYVKKMVLAGHEKWQTRNQYGMLLFEKYAIAGIAHEESTI